MRTLAESLNNIRLLDELSAQNTPVNRLHPLAKLLTTLMFLIVTVSYGKYDFSAMLPLTVFPMALLIAGEIPLMPLLRRLLLLSPLAIGLGIFNPCFDHAPMVTIFGLEISGGWMSFAVILLKFILTVTAALILIASTGMTGIAAALRMLRVPRIFVMQLLLTYRYIALLLDETTRVSLAYSLRSPFQRGVHYRAWGSLAGQLLIKTHLRAQRVYDSMLCRGFCGEYHTGAAKPFSRYDLGFIFSFTLFFLLARFVNLSLLLGELFK
jgi:cobalt/nickel transport system permease protein